MNDGKTYSQLILLRTFEERFDFLKMSGRIGFDTFGFDRYLNQDFYVSKEWQQARSFVIARDNGLDLACEDHEISGRIIVHHINPITPDDVIGKSDRLLDPNNLICVSDLTHRAIHYGGIELLPRKYEERRPNDTCPWKQ